MTEFTQHTTCEMVDITETVFVECENCIDKIRDPLVGGIYDCKCMEKTRIIQTCVKCAQIKDKISTLEDELDELMYHLNYDIKQYEDCDDRISRIRTISNNLRHYNRTLLEKS